MSDEETIRFAYDGSSVAFQALQAWGWGELVNLGFYPLWALPALLFGMAPFQQRLVSKAVELLAPGRGERILDAGCGRGGGSATIAAQGADVLGLDLLPDNVAQAQARFGTSPRLRFAVADVTRLPARAAGVDLAEGSLDGIQCLEAGFHFGAKGRRAFLEESWRVLRPGGRLVLVDFVWRDSQPERIAELDPERRVRDTWRFAEFEPLERYRQSARELGFRLPAERDWTRQVTDRFQHIATFLARAGNTRPGRAFFCALRPRLARISRADWATLVPLMRAHDRVRRNARYVAFRLEKPA
ncbi:MAG TPA: methyltransferase domain-containing protein [Myxococcota bacterium]|nr:methyltransferase domain-containing protein [Myxococcota bacterium]